MTFPKSLASAAVALSLLSAPVHSQRFDQETISQMAEQVAALQASIADSKMMIEESRSRIEENEYIIENAATIAGEMITDLGEQIDYYKAGSEFHQSLEKAKADLQDRITRWGADESAAKQKAAKMLGEVLTDFEAIDDRRDDLVNRALIAKSGLEITKDDIEVLLVVEAYDDLRTTFNDMLNTFDTTVVGAEQLNADLSEQAGLPVE